MGVKVNDISHVTQVPDTAKTVAGDGSFKFTLASAITDAELQAKVDYQVIELVKTQHEKAKNILSENKKKLDELAKFLYEKETITVDEFMQILNG